MNWSKINPYKIPIITGTLIFAIAVLGFTFFYGVKSSNAGDIAATVVFAQQAGEVDLKIKGNRNSRIYHLKGCASYNNIKEGNIVWFKTSEEAESRGYRMAKNC